MNKSLIMLGAGGHAMVVYDALAEKQKDLLGIVASNKNNCKTQIPVEYLGDDSIITTYSADTVLLINGVGGQPGSKVRSRLYDDLMQNGYHFLTVQHHTAVVSTLAKIDTGAQIMAGAIVQAGAKVGGNTLINTGARIDHEAIIGRHVMISPGAIVCGNVVIHDHAYIGAGAIIGPNVSIGEGAVIGCGTSIVKSVAPEMKILPAAVRRINQTSQIGM